MTARVIGLGGRLRAGKDTVADVLVEHHGYQKMGMSDTLAEALLTLDPIIPDWPAPGTATRYAEIIRQVGYVEAKTHPEVRRLLQKLGTEVGRDMIDEDVWVSMLERRIRQHRLAGTDVVITGIRYPNELAMIRRIGGTLVWVNRPGTDGPAAHASETSVTGTDFDVDVQNDGTLADLEAKADALTQISTVEDDEALPPPMFDLGDGPRSSGWYGGNA